MKKFKLHGLFLFPPPPPIYSAQKNILSSFFQKLLWLSFVKHKKEMLDRMFSLFPHIEQINDDHGL